MLCELCKNSPATVAIKQAADGEVRELFVCPACARKANGEDPENMLVELLFGAAFAVGTEAAESRCPSCGLTHKEFRKRSRLGCDACYAHFARELAPLLRDMHRGEKHAGKIPGREHQAVTGARLEAALRAAVAAQRFEEAARLHDALRALGAAPSVTAEQKGGRHGQP